MSKIRVCKFVAVITLNVSRCKTFIGQRITEVMNWVIKKPTASLPFYILLHKNIKIILYIICRYTLNTIIYTYQNTCLLKNACQVVVGEYIIFVSNALLFSSTYILYTRVEWSISKMIYTIFLILRIAGTILIKLALYFCIIFAFGT